MAHTHHPHQAARLDHISRSTRAADPFCVASPGRMHRLRMYIHTHTQKQNSLYLPLSLSVIIVGTSSYLRLTHTIYLRIGLVDYSHFF